MRDHRAAEIPDNRLLNLLVIMGADEYGRKELLAMTVNVHLKVTRCDHLKLTHPGSGKAHRRAAPK